LAKTRDPSSEFRIIMAFTEKRDIEGAIVEVEGLIVRVGLEVVLRGEASKSRMWLNPIF
jgi:hypothetical protein